MISSECCHATEIEQGYIGVKSQVCVITPVHGSPLGEADRVHRGTI